MLLSLDLDGPALAKNVIAGVGEGAMSYVLLKDTLGRGCHNVGQAGLINIDASLQNVPTVLLRYRYRGKDGRGFHEFGMTIGTTYGVESRDSLGTPESKPGHRGNLLE